MGRSNGEKAQRARADKEKRMGSKKAGGGGAAGIAARTATSTARVCSICRSVFMLTQKKPQLQEHVTSKHSGKTFADCFPTYDADIARESAPAAGAGAGSAGAGSGGYKPDKPPAEKKKKFKRKG